MQPSTLNGLARITAAVVVAITSFASSPRARAVVPPPDGGYPGFNTAEGQNALFSLTTGIGNTAAGWFSLKSNVDGSFNTAVGAGTLLLNIGDQSTERGIQNTAVGAVALLFNTTGSWNNAFGVEALRNNVTGDENNAFGTRALSSNTTGFANSAFGFVALQQSNGNSNTAIGSFAGVNLGAGNGNVYIGADVYGEDGVSDRTYIRNVNTTVQSGADFDTVTVRLVDGRLGHAVSSRRYKEDIQPMDKASEALFALKPVMFRYKKQVDPEQGLDYGLIAEEVAKVAPELAVRDREGKISNYRRDAINAMLLNEFLKEHKTVQKQDARLTRQEALIARQQKQIEALTAGLEQVTVQLEVSRSAFKTVVNNQ